MKKEEQCFKPGGGGEFSLGKILDKKIVLPHLVNGSLPHSNMYAMIPALHTSLFCP